MLRRVVEARDLADKIGRCMDRSPRRSLELRGIRRRARGSLIVPETLAGLNWKLRDRYLANAGRMHECHRGRGDFCDSDLLVVRASECG